MMITTCHRYLLLLLLLMAGGCAVAQEQAGWQELWQQLMNVEETGDETDTNTMELLEQLAQHPLNLNQTTREELLQLPFLSEQQVMDLTEYLDRYGPMRSLGELRMVPSMDYRQIELLPYFVYAGEAPPDTVRFPRIQTIARYAKQELAAAVRVPLYERRGFRNGYLGYRYRHWLRYELSYGDYVRLGLTGAQDAGEPFLAGGNAWGYDAYSYYLQIRKMGRIDNLVVGKYKLSTGMGLVLNNSFSLGKLAMLQNMGRTSRSIRPHTSGSMADYFQGAAATIRLSEPLQLTLFGSYRPIDATLNEDESARTLLTSGYHRTPLEMQKKHNTHLSSGGASVAFRRDGWHGGLTVAYTHLDRRLSPDTAQRYRQYYASGSNFVNVGVDYGYASHRLTLNGETAINADGAIATLNTVSYRATSELRLMALQRFYSYRYTALHAHAFSEAGNTQNESGLYLGATWHPLRGLHLSGYADVVYFPWLRYRVSQSSYAQDYLLDASYQLKNWTLKGRYRLHLRQLDNQKHTALRRHNEHRSRLALTYSDGERWTLTTQADLVQATNYDIENGWMVSENAGWKSHWWQVGLTAAYFDTDSYDSRIYTYERKLPHEFGFPSYYGRGLRLALTARAHVGKHLQVDVKIGHTHYFDRDAIGSGLQQIDQSYLTDLDLQARWRF